MNRRKLTTIVATGASVTALAMGLTSAPASAAPGCFEYFSGTGYSGSSSTATPVQGQETSASFTYKSAHNNCAFDVTARNSNHGATATIVASGSNPAFDASIYMVGSYNHNETVLLD
ncbi:hypothetical protein [Streptomyces sp. SID13031]|uniref:hypothetical protein n=1 Tax=Streptomyces sp. SID13031 TaxID=2706046 RepID=UPI0013C5B9C9|nr:hypothetical protein [Streptomyces sp. SID13031]NEA36897.1 hypothetical protein [Streptomyces sp. SID13031]